MHPNTFLRTFWQPEIRPQIFVAMSFDPRYEQRYKEVITPAINAITWRGQKLTPLRVDVSKTGDSILTEIMDGITHSVMVLADVSTIGKDAATSKPYRNSNVMYEVGIALASRQTTDVLLVRDDDDKFLFDVSTIPHKRIIFTDTTNAIKELAEELVNRLKAQQFEHDARVQIAVRTLTEQDTNILKRLLDGHPAGTGFTSPSIPVIAAVRSLANKGLIVLAGRFEEGDHVYFLTPIGYEVANHLSKLLPIFEKAAATPLPSSPVP